MDENPHRTDEHPHSEKQTNTDDQKLTTAVAALTDPKFPLPVLDEKASTLRYILSFGTLSALLGSMIVTAWYFELELLQTSQPVVLLSAFFASIFGALFLTGTVWVDWFELVVGYWWLSIPIGALAGLAFVLNQEASASLHEQA